MVEWWMGEEIEARDGGKRKRKRTVK